MNIKDCQREMRYAFIGGFAGQLVSGVIWLVAAAIATWIRPPAGMATLFFGSMFIFPLTQLLVRLMGRPAKVSSENSLWNLGSQIAFTVPINFLVVGAATLYRETWFFPAALIVVGSHYLPFITLYGLKEYGLLAALMVVSGIMIGLYAPPLFSLAGWVGGILMAGFALWLRLNPKNSLLFSQPPGE